MRCEYDSTPTGGSSPRTPRKRRKSASASPRTAATPPATTATTATSASVWRPPVPKRRRAAIQRTTAPSARPPAAATEPARIRPRTPADECDDEEAVRRELASARRDPGRGESEGDGGERGEVVVAEEGRLAPAGVPRSEDVDAEELQERDGDRDGRPEHEPAEHDREVRGASHEQRHGQCEKRVLDELQEAHEMVVEERVVEGDGRKVWNASQARRAAPASQSERPARRRASPSLERDDRRGDHDDEDGDIRQADVDGRRAQSDSEIRLVALVQEEERDRTREHEGSERGRGRRGCGVATTSACCRAPRSSPRHYRAAGLRRILPRDALPTLTAACPPGFSGAGRRRLRGSTPLSRAASPGRSSRRASSGSTTSACS